MFRISNIIIRRMHDRATPDVIPIKKQFKIGYENPNVPSYNMGILPKKNITLKKNAKKIYDIINKKNYKFSKRMKDNDELYGSIKPREIAKTIESLDKIEIKPSQFDLDKEINKIGTYEAKINLHAEVQAKIHIEVVKLEETN